MSGRRTCDGDQRIVPRFEIMAPVEYTAASGQGLTRDLSQYGVRVDGKPVGIRKGTEVTLRFSF